MPNLDLVRKNDISAYRKVAIGTWRYSYDPAVHGTVQLRMDEALRYLAAYREKTGKKLTVSHLMIKAAAMVLKETPDANAILRWNRIYVRKRIGIFFQVALADEGPSKIDLSGATIHDAEQKNLAQIYDECDAKTAKVRARADPAFEKSRRLTLKIPYLALNTMFRMFGFFSYTLNLDLSAFGMENDPFGGLILTNIGALDLDTAFVPLVPYSRVPIILAMGKIKDQLIVQDGQAVIAKMMNVNATFDHRFIDGFHAASMSRILRAWIEHPYEHFDAV